MNAILQPPGLTIGGTLSGPMNRPGYVRLGWPGLDPLNSTLDIVIMDDSGSLSAPGGNDPIGNRYEEARHAIEVLSNWTTSSRQKVAVIHFDYPQIEIDGPYRLDRTRNRDQVLASLAVPHSAHGSSCLAPAMGAAHRLAREHGGIVRCTIFSDFELADAQPTQPYDQIRTFPGQVHAVALNADPPTVLTELPNVTVTRIASDSPPGFAAAALMHSLATGRRGSRRASLRTTRSRSPDR